MNIESEQNENIMKRRWQKKQNEHNEKIRKWSKSNKKKTKKIELQKNTSALSHSRLVLCEILETLVWLNSSHKYYIVVKK